MEIILCFILAIVGVSSQSFQYRIFALHKLPFRGCKQLNNSDYQCSSLQQALYLLSNSSTDVVLDASVHYINFSYSITDLQNIRIRSKTDKHVTIECTANTKGAHNLDTGIAFIRVRNLFIQHVNIVQCGMKHISADDIGAGEFITVRSALYIQNSTNIFLYDMWYKYYYDRYVVLGCNLRIGCKSHHHL